jgi:GH24 family phage-related lysozyme (muramidase)
MNLDALRDRIQRAEGLRLTPYRDSRGFWTIGRGHLLPQDLTATQRATMVLTREEADALFESDLASAIHGAASFAWWHVLDAERQAVIVEMVFQMGVSGVSEFVRMAEAIKARKFHAAAYEMLDSDWARQTPSRVKHLASAMRDGQWSRAGREV